MPNKYISLRTINLNRTSHNSLDEEYQRRLHSPSTIVLDFERDGQPLFVALTPRLLAMIVGIHKDSARLLNLQNHALPGIAKEWYVNKVLVDEIKLTNDMENVHSTRKEVKAAIDSIDRPGQPQNVRFYGMASKYLSLLKHATIPLKTCGDIRKLYGEFVEKEVVAEDTADALDGQLFRAGPVFVQNSHGKIVHKGSFPESMIIEHMEKALGILNDSEIDRLIRIAVFHYLFGYIHPFYNGNGRLSRFISSMLLSDELNTLAGLRLSYVIKDHKRQYDKAFIEGNDKRGMGDITDFVEGFCEYVSIALRDMIETLQTGRNALESLHHYIASNDAFIGVERIIEILGWNGLFAEDPLSIDDLQFHANCKRRKAQNAINVAKALGILTVTRDGHRLMYTIKPDVWTELIKPSQSIPNDE